MLSMAPLPPRSSTEIPECGEISWPFKVQRSFKGWSPSTTAHGTVTTWPEFNGSSPKENGNNFGMTGNRNKVEKEEAAFANLAISRSQ